MVFDKTGTLTEGRPQVVEIMTSGDPITETDMLRLVASAEASSEHPLAQAIVDRASDRGLALSPAEAFTAIPGHGAQARVDGKSVLVGNRKLMLDRSIALDGHGPHAASLEGAGRTVVYIAIDGRFAGLIAVADAIRPTARRAVEGRAAVGVQGAMLTGGNTAP